MALDMQGRRAEGVSQLPANTTQGSRGKGNDAGDAVNLPTSSMEEKLDAAVGSASRGTEANTNLIGSESEPMIDNITAGERPVSDPPFAFPDSSGKLATDGNGPAWDSADSSARNSRPLVIPHDSFTGMGEPPYTEGNPDGRS